MSSHSCKLWTQFIEFNNKVYPLDYGRFQHVSLVDTTRANTSETRVTTFRETFFRAQTLDASTK